MDDMSISSKKPSTLILGVSLIFAVTTCSSAGVVFDSLTAQGVPPFLAASWRLWCQLCVLFIPFCISLKSLREKDEKRRLAFIETFSNTHDLKLNTDKSEESSVMSSGQVLESTPFVRNYPESNIWKYISSIPLLLCSGFFLGIHFSSWVYSIEKTSLVHSLLWVSMGPIVINWGHWLLFGCCGITSKPSMKETFGAILGITGACIMLADVSKDGLNYSNKSSLIHAPSLVGDLAAFIGAFAVSIYLIIGQKCRKWMSLWLYAFPVVGMAAFTSMIAALLDQTQPSSFYGYGNSCVLGFLNQRFFLRVLYLGAGPGVCGHTVLNALLKYVSPLTISTAMLLEPLLGSYIGYLFGMQALPSVYTFSGGLILLIGLLLVIIGEGDRQMQANDQSSEEEDDERNNLIYDNIQHEPSKVSKYGSCSPRSDSK